MRMQELGGDLEREIAACRVAPDDDVGWGQAQVQEVLDGGYCLAQLLREGLFWCESCVTDQQQNLAFTHCKKTHNS